MILLDMNSGFVFERLTKSQINVILHDTKRRLKALPWLANRVTKTMVRPLCALPQIINVLIIFFMCSPSLTVTKMRLASAQVFSCSV